MNDNTVGIVTVEVDGVRYRGAYEFQQDEFVVTAYGLVNARINAALLTGEDERVVMNLARLMLTDMVTAADTSGVENFTRTMRDSTSTLCY